MIRRRLLLAIFMLLATSLVSSESATWAMLGGGYCASFESATKNNNSSTASMNSFDAAFEYQMFRGDSAIGLYYRFDLLVPTSGSHTLSGIAEPNRVSAYDGLLGFMMAIGPAFRFPAANNLNILLGLGASWNALSGYYERLDPLVGNVRFSMFSYSFGVNADVGVGIRLSDSVLLKPGASMTYGFVSHSSITKNGATSDGWASQYSGFGISACLQLAINLGPVW
jgi:hypothetical protein